MKQGLLRHQFVDDVKVGDTRDDGQEYECASLVEEAYDALSRSGMTNAQFVSNHNDVDVFGCAQNVLRKDRVTLDMHISSIRSSGSFFTASRSKK